MKTKILMIVGLSLACSLSLSKRAYAQGEAYVIIVHPDNPTQTISKAKVSRLLLKEVSRWDGDGFTENVRPIDQDSTSSVRAAFSRDVHGRSVSSIKNYWQRQIFSGREAPPPEVSSDEEVIAFVMSHPGAIGYVSANTRLDGVKEVSISNKASGRENQVAAPEITNPAIRKIIQSRATRVQQLNKYKASGSLGENNQALVEIRRLDALPLQERAAVQTLVKAENEDRERMFKEIAAATGTDLSQLPKIRSTYATTLRQKARRLDWIQMPDGSWRHK